MCGGVGSRFWPYSRQAWPKQFIDFFGTGRSLLQMAVDRMEGIVPVENIFMLTNEQYAQIIKQQLPQLRDEQILLEPARRNTAPCIAWGAYHIQAINPDAKIMVAPSDHLVLKTDEFRTAVLKAYRFIEQNDALLTLGIKPNRPETGYGYIQVGEQLGDDFSAVKTFTEKPNEELARVFLDSGEFFWNSGMFFWSARCIIDAMAHYAPDIATLLQGDGTIYGTPAEMPFINEHYPSCPNISIDFAVMEKAPNVYVECVDFGWSDLGTWGSLLAQTKHDLYGNSVIGQEVSLFDTHNCIVHTLSEKKVVVQGLDGYIVAEQDGKLLICKLEEEQRIRQFSGED
jgi:mannose-1-phosphate guanylyltransferase